MYMYTYKLAGDFRRLTGFNTGHGLFKDPQNPGQEFLDEREQ